jgi:DNA polymerase III alpha subunit
MRVRSAYSFKTAIGTLDEVFSRVQELGWRAAPLTDRMSTFGFVRWTKLCEKAGVKPVYGVEIPCVPLFGEKKLSADYWTFIARDDISAINKLVFKAGTNPSKEPALSYDQALSAEGVEVVCGERFMIEAVTGDVPDWFHVSLSPSIPIGLYRKAKARGMSFVASPDNLYAREDDKELFRVALGRRSTSQTYPLHLVSDPELAEYLGWFGIDRDDIAEAFDNRDAILDRCTAQLRKAELLVPEKPKPLRDLCLDGAAKRGMILTEAYSGRLEMELGVISEKGFEDYFYILHDIVGWAKERMAVGPARGSSCGSLVCYLLGITAVDPLKYELIFERFIDANRDDLPDVDIDFSDERRDQVFDYAAKTYGEERVARLGAVGMFQARSTLKAAASSLRIPGWRVDKVADSLIERKDGDARADRTLEDTLSETEAGRELFKHHPEVMIACTLEGQPHNIGKHAAGLLLTDKPMLEYVAVNARDRVAWCDKKDAETLNLLKIDALGLKQLSIFERALQLIGVDRPNEFLEAVPLDDAATFDVLNRHQYRGVFQFNGMSVAGLARQIKFESLNDFVAVSALSRPGPLTGGATALWVRRRNGESYGKAVHPILDEVTKDDYGVIVYQETVMKICRELGKMSWADVNKVRKIMGKTQGNEAFAVFWEKFRDGCAENGLNEHNAKVVWDQINGFGSYAFNKSHALAYGMVSYWSAYMKAHHRLEYAAACLDSEAEPDKQLSILRELAGEGIDYVAVDPEQSIDRWIVSEDRSRLLGPIQNIKGIGSATAIDILDSRQTGKPLKAATLKKLKEAKTPIDNLYPIEARIKDLYPDLTAINIFSEPMKVKDIQPGVRGEILMLARIQVLNQKDENDPALIQKRNGVIRTGPTKFLNMFFADDTDEVFVKIDPYKFNQWKNREQTQTLGQWVVDNARVGKSIFAVVGTCPPDFRMIKVKNMRYIGEME